MGGRTSDKEPREEKQVIKLSDDYYKESAALQKEHDERSGDIQKAAERISELIDKSQDGKERLILAAIMIGLVNTHVATQQIALLRKSVLLDREVIPVLFNAHIQAFKAIDEIAEKLPPSEEIESLKTKLSEYEPIMDSLKKRVADKEKELLQAQELQKQAEQRLKEWGGLYS